MNREGRGNESLKNERTDHVKNEICTRSSADKPECEVSFRNEGRDIEERKECYFIRGSGIRKSVMKFRHCEVKGGVETFRRGERAVLESGSG